VFNELYIVAANIQRVFMRDHVRSLLPSYHSRSSTDFLILSDIARKTPEQVEAWTADCEELGLGSIFTVNCQTACHLHLLTQSPFQPQECPSRYRR
jgi:hypothetical protein